MEIFIGIAVIVVVLAIVAITKNKTAKGTKGGGITDQLGDNIKPKDTIKN